MFDISSHDGVTAKMKLEWNCQLLNVKRIMDGKNEETNRRIEWERRVSVFWGYVLGVFHSKIEMMHNLLTFWISLDRQIEEGKKQEAITISKSTQ